MPTVIACRPRPFRVLVVGAMQLAIAAGLSWLLLNGRDSATRASSTEPLRLAAGFLIVLPFAMLGLRNVHRLLARASVTVDEDGVSAFVPQAPFFLSPLLRTARWSSPWGALDVHFVPGRRAVLEIAGDGEPLRLRGGEFDVSLYDLDARLRESAPPAAAERLPVAGAIRRFPGTSVAWLAVLGIAVLVATIGLGLAVQSPGNDPSGVLSLPVFAAFGFLALALGGRREAVGDSRGFFLVHGRRTAFIPAKAAANGEVTLKGEFPGFSLMTVRGVDEHGTVVVKMNEVLGVGLPLERVKNDLETRIRRGFANPGAAR
jgi:hypothetical protein